MGDSKWINIIEQKWLYEFTSGWDPLGNCISVSFLLLLGFNFSYLVIYSEPQVFEQSLFLFFQIRYSRHREHVRAQVWRQGEEEDGGEALGWEGKKQDSRKNFVSIRTIDGTVADRYDVVTDSRWPSHIRVHGINTSRLGDAFANIFSFKKGMSKSPFSFSPKKERKRKFGKRQIHVLETSEFFWRFSPYSSPLSCPQQTKKFFFFLLSPFWHDVFLSPSPAARLFRYWPAKAAIHYFRFHIFFLSPICHIPRPGAN